ncbi:MAG: type 4a pilus biogenesis protein PilO [Gammaproteobacteria bacterium]|nr:type 4a pilus biogenesis protein PilO [Gammaproteobacteria bacterium]
MAFEDLRGLELSEISSWPLWLKMVGVTVICVGILFAGYWFLIKGEIESLQAAEKQELQLRQTFLKKKALAVNLPAYREQMQEMEESFGVMLRQLPNRTEVPELLIDITQAGLGRGLQFVLFKPQKKRNADFYAILPISIQVVGSYHELGEFVSDLAALPRIVTLGNITLAPVKKSDKLSMTATTSTYHYLDDPEDTSAKQKPKKKARSTKS